MTPKLNCCCRCSSRPVHASKVPISMIECCISIRFQFTQLMKKKTSLLHSLRSDIHPAIDHLLFMFTILSVTNHLFVTMCTRSHMLRVARVYNSLDYRDGLTALHCAASRGHTECINVLINLCGAPIDLIGKLLMRPIMSGRRRKRIV